MHGLLFVYAHHLTEHSFYEFCFFWGVAHVASSLPVSVKSFPITLLFYSEDGGSKFVRNVGTYLSNYTASSPGRSYLHVTVNYLAHNAFCYK
jgi:hypothetical protein